MNGTALEVVSKEVDISIPTNNNQIANGMGYQTAGEVNSLIASALGNIQSLSISIVTNLPEVGVSGTLYFLSNSDGKNPNIYDEYIWLGNQYEKIGAIDIDMNGYLKSSEVTAITNNEIDNIIA